MKLEIVNTGGQKTEAWKIARLGRLTGSRAGDATALGKSKDKETNARRNIRIRTALERVTGRSLDSTYLTQAMREGEEREPLARQQLELLLRAPIYETDFIQSLDCMAGASLDGHLGNFSALVSIKCCQPTEHAEYLRDDAYIDRDYMQQILHELWLIESASEHIFANYNPDFPPGAKLKVRVFKRKQLVIELGEYGRLAEQFLSDVDAEEQFIRSLAVTA